MEQEIFVGNYTYSTNNSTLNFYIKGTKNSENEDYNSLDNLVDSCFNKLTNYKNISQIVSWIRTIFKNIKEEDLTINIISDEESISVWYKNKKLKSFEFIESIYDSARRNDEFIAKYTIENGIDFSIPAFRTAEKYSRSRDLVNIFVDQLKELENIKTVTLNHDSKLFCEIYKTFYQENPDFSKEDTNLKIQTMMVILEEYGITSPNYYSSFKIYSESKIPISNNLSYLVSQLAPLGEISTIEEPVQLDDKAKKKIETVGNIVTSTTHCIPEELGKISMVLHARTHNLPWNASYQQISEFTHYSIEEVESSLQLTKKIEDTLKK